MSDADPRNLLDDLIARARRAGADEADALLVEAASLSLARRLGKPEKLERAESQDLGLRVLIGKRQAIVSSSDRAPAILGELVGRAVAMARSVPEDPYCGLASPDEIDRNPPHLELCDPVEPAPEELTARASAAEVAARAVPGVTNSEGAEAGWSRSRVAMAASNGFSGGYEISRHGVSVSVIAGSGTGMERDYDFSSTVFAADLADAAHAGENPGLRNPPGLEGIGDRADQGVLADQIVEA
jgi:PmbA protein